MGTLGKHWKLTAENKHNQSEGKKRFLKEHPEVVEKSRLRLAKFVSVYGYKKGEKKPPMTVEHKAKLSPTMFKKGQVAHNKGIKGVVKLWPNGRIISNEWRANMSKALIGKYVGENSFNWKGGVTPENMKIRTSRDYYIWRAAVFQRDDYICQHCNVRGGDLEADHIKPFSLFPELRFAIDNGRTLCVKCHAEVTKKQHKEGLFPNAVKTRFQLSRNPVDFSDFTAPMPATALPTEMQPKMSQPQ